LNGTVYRELPDPHRDREESRARERRLHILVAEYTEATGGRHPLPEYHNPRRDLPWVEALLARPIQIEAQTFVESQKPVYKYLASLHPERRITAALAPG
jgi:hypothetical protein